MEETIKFIVANKVLLASVGIAVISEAMSLIPGIKSNGLVQLVLNLLKSIAGKGSVAVLSLLLLGACTPLISNTVMMGCGQDRVSLTNKADTDQTPSTSTSAAVPVSVGAQPNSSGTVNGTPTTK